MRKLILIIALISTSLISFSQEKGDFRLGVYGQLNTFRYKQIPMFGLCGEYFLSHHVALNYRYGMGYNDKGEVTAHINPSLLGLIFASSSDALLLSFMIPEGVSYHAYPKENIEISPYISPLGSEINLYDNPSFVFSCNFGINIHLQPLKDLTVTPNLGGTLIYRNGEVIPSVGVSLNYNFH